MSRYAKANVTIDELKEKVISTARRCDSGYDGDGDDELYYIINSILQGDHRNETIVKDLKKIDFDFENSGSGVDCCSDLDEYEMLGDFPVLWCMAGGDWELPVVFCMYISDKGALRAYVPSEGNVYNHKHKAAYGNNEDFFDPDDIEDGYMDEEELEGMDDDPRYRKWDADKMREDVKNRIVVK